MKNKISTIEKLILLAGYSQKDFAKKVGETESALSLYKNGKREISLAKFLNWCKIIKFTNWDQLFENN